MFSQHGFKKEDGRIMVKDPECPHNYVPKTQEIDHQPQPWKVRDLVLQLENDNDEVGALIRAEPSLRESTVAYLSANIAVFPELRRDSSLYGYSDGVLSIGTWEEGKCTPGLSFTPYNEHIPDEEAEQPVVRVYFDTPFDHAWLFFLGGASPSSSVSSISVSESSSADGGFLAGFSPTCVCTGC